MHHVRKFMIFAAETPLASSRVNVSRPAFSSLMAFSNCAAAVLHAKSDRA
jgi:hypothetical protein